MARILLAENARAISIVVFASTHLRCSSVQSPAKGGAHGNTDALDRPVVSGVDQRGAQHGRSQLFHCRIMATGAGRVEEERLTVVR